MFNKYEGCYSDDINMATAATDNNDNVPQDMSENYDKQKTRQTTKVCFRYFHMKDSFSHIPQSTIKVLCKI